MVERSPSTSVRGNSVLNQPFPEKFDLLNQPGRRLLVFLRHSGCPFCKQTLGDVAAARAEIESSGAKIVLVHMMDDRDQAKSFFARYGLDELEALPILIKSYIHCWRSKRDV